MKGNRDPRNRRKERGSALFLAAILVVVAVGLSYSTIFVSVAELKKSRLDAAKTRAYYAADAGVELGLNEIKGIISKSVTGRPFEAIDGLFFDELGNPMLNRVYVDHDLLLNGRTYGTVNVQMSLAGSGKDFRDIRITTDAYVPRRYSRVNGELVERFSSMKRLEKTVRIRVEPSSVFDYGYFINNWGWFYGDSIVSNGNVRANGQFDAGGHKPIINGTPRYDELVITKDPTTGAVTADLKGYKDDNKDGLKDGNDGGIYSGWNIVGSDKVRGMASDDANKHEYVTQVPMPNLNDTTLYEEFARTREVDGKVVPSSIHVGKTQYSDEIYGDDPTERGNLYLYGTETDPIVIDGPVVVKGHLIIYGKITGQGSLYVEGNIYIADNLEYLNPPTSPLPPSNSEADTEKWIAENYDKDMVGLFAKESIIAGNYEDSDWRSNVGEWLAHPLNQSAEDSGTDLIPNTRAGRDGILNTADDDVLEGDSVWTVERYSMADYESGIINRNFVGTPIAGTGEDIDADGVFDPTITLAEFDNRPLNSGQYGGNVNKPAIVDYGVIGRMDISQIDGILYTNHAFALRTKDAVVFNGALISRNESIIYGNNFTINHDRRLLGGAGNPNVVLPMVFSEIMENAHLETELNLGAGFTMPLVPSLKERLEADPENGGATGRVYVKVAVPASE